MIIVIVKKELLGAMFAIVVTDHQVHWLATALFERIESSIREDFKKKPRKFSELGQKGG